MGDPFLVCPFNKSHKIMMSRFQSHLLKCMKSHSMKGPTICPYNSQHIVDASQIVQHCIICPNIKDVLIRTNTCEDKSDSPNNDVTSTPNSAYNPATNIKINSIVHSDEMKIEAPIIQSLRRPKNENSETSIKVPESTRIEKSEKNKNLKDSPKNNVSFKESNPFVSDYDSKNLISFFCDEPESSEKNNIDYGEIYRKLEALEEKEINIAKEMEILRQKEKEIEAEKKELIEIFKSIAVYMNTNNNHRNNNKEHKNKIVALMTPNDEIDTNRRNNSDEYNEQASNIFNSKFEENSSYLHHYRPSMTPQTSSPPTPGSSPTTNKTQVFGRGIMRAYNKKKALPNKMDQS